MTWQGRGGAAPGQTNSCPEQGVLESAPEPSARQTASLRRRSNLPKTAKTPPTGPSLRLDAPHRWICRSLLHVAIFVRGLKSATNCSSRSTIFAFGKWPRGDVVRCMLLRRRNPIQMRCQSDLTNTTPRRRLQLYPFMHNPAPWTRPNIPAARQFLTNSWCLGLAGQARTAALFDRLSRVIEDECR